MKGPAPAGGSLEGGRQGGMRQLVVGRGGVAACVVFVTGASCAGEAVRRCRRGRRRGGEGDGRARRQFIQRTGVDLISGAAGEVAEMIICYPMDTIKVQCQALNCNFVQGLRYFSRYGFNGRLLGRLYAGAGPATLMSLLVGPLYFASYSAAKRLATNWSKRPSNLSPTEKQASVKKGGHDSANNGQRGVQGWIAINMFASLVAGVAVSLVESPSELFRHQVQAGVVERGMFPTMLAATRRGGLRSLYFCYLPYLIKALPHDVAELMTYGLLTDARSVAHAHPRHPLGAIAAVPDRVGDLFVGAAAGIMAVLVSMPADTISTRMQTVERAGLREKGPLGMAVSFFAAGRRLAARGGVGALYKGCAPRLLRHVPASMVFWPVLVGCQRELHRALGYTEG